MVVPMLRMVGDEATLYPHTLTYDMSCKCLRFGIEIKVKKVSSYIARYPVLRTAQSDLHFTPWQTCSFLFQLLWESFSHVVITARRLLIHMSATVCIARYSFIQLSEMWQCGVIKLAKGSKRPQWDLKPGSLD